MKEMAVAIADVVGGLGATHVSALAAAYRTAGTFSPGKATKVRQAVPAPHHADVDRLNQSWALQPNLDGVGIALALEAAESTLCRADVATVEVVVTGPNSLAAPVRLTSEVVRQLIDEATTRVTLVSFAAYQMTSIINALDGAVARGVSVALILESPENLEGGGGAKVYSKYRIYHWPTERREPPGAKLHAKAVIIDNRDVLLTSANMTAAAYDKNIELGVLCRGGSVARQVQHHFDALIARGVLTAVW
jgi:cardiolipin synthase A/B